MANWEKEYEHWRDRGRTWGPGVDDVREPTEEEIARQEARMAAYRQKLKEYSVEPRKEFADAGEKLKEDFPGPYDGWKKEYNERLIGLCQEACKSLGYSMELGWVRDHLDANQEKNTFSIAVEYYGWLPDRGGNIHKFFVCGIEDAEDCLQLVADFAAIGTRSTTWYGQNFHYSTRDTGELRNELIRRYGIAQPQSDSVEKLIEGAAGRSNDAPERGTRKEERGVRDCMDK